MVLSTLCCTQSLYSSVYIYYSKCCSMNSAYDTLAMIYLAPIFACTVLKDTELHDNSKRVKCVFVFYIMQRILIT